MAHDAATGRQGLTAAHEYAILRDANFPTARGVGRVAPWAGSPYTDDPGRIKT